MKISTRGRYGLRIMFELARHHNSDPLTRNEIARNQDLSIQYIPSIMKTLISNGFVRSVQGNKGGYVLAIDPSDITLDQIIEALEGPIAVVDCVFDDKYCDRMDVCPTQSLWVEMSTALKKTLSSKTLKKLVDGYKKQK